VDLPGHGLSPSIDPYSLRSVTEAIAARFDASPETADTPLLVLGWSLGATIAMHWASARPARISALMLVAATPCFVTRPDWPQAVEEATLRRFADELEVAYRLTLHRFVALQVQGSERPREVLAQLRAQLFARGEPSPLALRAALQILVDTDLRADIGAIRKPALVIGGDRDVLTPVAACEWLAAALPAGTMNRVEGAAHIPFLSHPERFVSALMEFAHEH